MDPNELRQQRADLIGEARAILDSAEGENRNLTEDEQAQYDERLAQIDDLEARIARLERQQRLETRLGQSQTRPLHTQSQPEPPEPPEIGMSQNEIRQYSLIRALRAAASGDWREAGLERRASEAMAERLGRQPGGFFVPYDWMAAEARDLTVGTATAGGHTVATDLLAENFIDMLRNRMVVRQAGATVLSGLVGNIAIPRQTGGATAYWVTEGNAPTESQQAVDQVTMSPRTVGAFTDYSRKLLLQSSLDIEAFVRGDLATVLALEMDRAALHGSGAGAEPTGVANITGIGSVAIGANGGAPLWSHIINLETEVAQDNADIGRLAYITNAKVRGKLKQTDKGTDTGQMVFAEGQQPLNGYSALVTNQVRSDLTKGTGSGLSAIFFGNWADLLIGLWGGLDILVDPYTASTSGTVRIVALQDADINVRHPESFAAVVDADTT